MPDHSNAVANRAAERGADPTKAITFNQRTNALAQANVVTGMRSGMDRASEEHLQPESRQRTRMFIFARTTPPPRKGEKVYVSHIKGLRIQLKAFPDLTDPITRQRNPGDNLSAQFRDGVYRVRDDQFVAKPGTPGAPEGGLRICDVLEDKVRCKLYQVEFFRYEDVIAQMEDDTAEDVTRMVENLSPAARDLVLERLTRNEDVEGSSMPIGGKKAADKKE
jgi:hypothetical protein